MRAAPTCFGITKASKIIAPEMKKLPSLSRGVKLATAARLEKVEVGSIGPRLGTLFVGEVDRFAEWTYWRRVGCGRRRFVKKLCGPFPARGLYFIAAIQNLRDELHERADLFRTLRRHDSLCSSMRRAQSS